MSGDDYLEPRVGTTLPLVALREQLAEARSRGESFEACWPATVKAVLSTVRPPLRGEWRRCLERTRETWERCYQRVPATPAELALEQAHILIDRKPLPDRACSECDGPMPARAKSICAECRRGSEVRDRHLGPAGERQQPNVAVKLEEDWSRPEQMELVA